MKQISKPFAIAAAIMAAHATAQSSIISQSDPAVGGIGYRWTVTLGMSDTASVSRHVGAWAWEDSALFGTGETPVGWTHNSEWIALRLEVAALVTLRLENVAGVPNPTSQNPEAIAPDNLFPGMSIYSGWDNDLAPQEFADLFNDGEAVHNWHSYVNRGDIDWAEDTSYFTHLEPDGTHWIEATIQMPAGDYTIAVGGKSTSETSEPRQGYLATFTTAPVPEPGTAAAAILGGVALLGRRRSRRFEK